jgi:hypothetical protein
MPEDSQKEPEIQVERELETTDDGEPDALVAPSREYEIAPPDPEE